MYMDIFHIFIHNSDSYLTTHVYTVSPHGMVSPGHDSSCDYMAPYLLRFRISTMLLLWTSTSPGARCAGSTSFWRRSNAPVSSAQHEHVRSVRVLSQCHGGATCTRPPSLHAVRCRVPAIVGGIFACTQTVMGDFTAPQTRNTGHHVAAGFCSWNRRAESFDLLGAETAVLPVTGFCKQVCVACGI